MAEWSTFIYTSELQWFFCGVQGNIIRATKFSSVNFRYWFSFRRIWFHWFWKISPSVSFLSPDKRKFCAQVNFFSRHYVASTSAFFSLLKLPCTAFQLVAWIQSEGRSLWLITFSIIRMLLILITQSY